MLTPTRAIIGMTTLAGALRRQGIPKPEVMYISQIRGFRTPIGNIPEEIVNTIMEDDSEPIYHWLLWLTVGMRLN
ncbi:hypothetical protein ES703_113492 [subsurface metagenome]